MTTAACPAYAYEARDDAFVVKAVEGGGRSVDRQRRTWTSLRPVLSGSGRRTARRRMPSIRKLFPGGSSGGSGVAVAHGIVSFALGTDTAGSGRVPAALNNIVGLKPSLGSLSATGVVPACRSLDTVSVFALTVDDSYHRVSGCGSGSTPRTAMRGGCRRPI